jgi:PIF1-like helicase
MKLEIELDLNVEIPMMHIVDSSQDLITFVFPDDMLSHPMLCLSQVILAPTNAQVDAYNNNILTNLPREQCTYIAADSLEECDDVVDSTQDKNLQLPTPDAILDYVARQHPTVMNFSFYSFFTFLPCGYLIFYLILSSHGHSHRSHQP